MVAFSCCKCTLEICTHMPRYLPVRKTLHTHIHTAQVITTINRTCNLLCRSPVRLYTQTNIHSHIYVYMWTFAAYYAPLCLLITFLPIFSFSTCSIWFCFPLLLLLLLRQFSSAPIFRPLFWLMTLYAHTDCRPKMRSRVSDVAQWPALNS